MIKCIHKQTSALKKAIKAPTKIATTIEEINPIIGLIYIPEN